MFQKPFWQQSLFTCFELFYTYCFSIWCVSTKRRRCFRYCFFQTLRKRKEKKLFEYPMLPCRRSRTMVNFILGDCVNVKMWEHIFTFRHLSVLINFFEKIQTLYDFIITLFVAKKIISAKLDFVFSFLYMIEF